MRRTLERMDGFLDTPLFADSVAGSALPVAGLGAARGARDSPCGGGGPVKTDFKA